MSDPMKRLIREHEALLAENALLRSDQETLAWIIAMLYNGYGWRTMQAERPEIDEVMARLPKVEIA